MADPEKKIIERVLKLLVGTREVIARQHEIVEEAINLLGGGKSQADHIKHLESRFDEVWCLRYAPGDTSKYVWAYAKDRPQMARLLKKLAPGEIEDRMANYMRNEDAFYVNARHNFAVFVASINSHAGPAGRPERTPWHCPHTPKRCGSESHCHNLKIMNQGRREKGQPLLVDEESPF